MADVRRIRRLRKPTKWELLVWRWQTWLEDVLERAVCCGVDPTPSHDDLRFTLGLRKESSLFSIGSMAAYVPSGSEEELHVGDAWMSDTDSESDLEQHSIDMNARISSVDDSDEEGSTPAHCASVCSEHISFGDEGEDDNEANASKTRPEGNDEPEDTTSQDNVAATIEEALYHQALFNCVLVELLSHCHPAATWGR